GPSGPPVLLLHDVALGGTAKAHRALFEALRGERPLVVPDLPRAPTREDHVRVVDELLSDVSRRYGATVDVVAVGTTCELAAASVVRSPRPVRSFVMIAPTGFDGTHPVLRRVRAILARRSARLRDR